MEQTLDLKSLIAAQPVIHTRTIHLSTFPLDDAGVIVQGELKDHRLRTIFDLAGRMIEPGVVHHMIIRVLVRDNPLRIVEAEAEMVKVPMDQCRQTLDVMDKVPGLEIKAGFSGRVKALLGGKQGCTHLSHLLMVMAQEIVHGWLTHDRREKRPVPASLEDVRERGFLLNSCRLWTENGSKMKELSDAITAFHGK
ncbi:MAG: DUF2889 domain-containing protein [Pseudomonadota bacterium]